MKTLQIERTDSTFLLPVADVLAVHCAVTKDEARYYLQGVYVEYSQHGDAIDITATDGSILHNIRVDPAAHMGADTSTQNCSERRGFILSVDVMEKAFKAKTQGALWMYGDTSTGLLQFIDFDGSATAPRVGVCEFSRIDGTFPDWRRVMPAELETTGPATFNPALLAKVAKARDVMAKADRCSTSAPIQIHPGAGNDPMRTLIGGLGEFVAVIMPTRWTHY